MIPETGPAPPTVRGFYGLPEEDEGPDLRGNFERFLDHLERRAEQRKPVNMIIDGRETGVGKSTLAITISRRRDPTFDQSRIVFSAAELFHVYDSAQPGSFVIYDEAVTGMLSRKGSRDEELAGLISAISISRKNGIGTILLVPKIHMLDAIAANGLVPLYLFVEDRGRARVHRAYKGARYRKSQPRIPYDLWDKISPIGWKDLDRDPFFRAYNERAKEKNRDFFSDMEQISAVKRAKLLGQPRPKADSEYGGNVPPRAESVPTPPPPPRACRWCGRKIVGSYQLGQHEGSCPGNR